MTDRLLYALHIPSNAQVRTRADIRRQLSKQGTLSTGPVAVDDISLEPGQQLLTGYYADRFGTINAREVEELFGADGITTVPFTTRDGDRGGLDGYYSLEDVDVSQSAPNRTDRVQQFDGRLTKEGTRRDHYRAVRTSPDSVSQPFGSDSEIPIAISARAQDVEWYDNRNGTTESATVQRSIETEHDTVNVYDASQPNITDPWLVYDLPHRYEWRTDCRVWDDYDRQKSVTEVVSSSQVGTATVGATTVGETRTVASQWQRVFKADHDYRGQRVIESGTLRLEPDLENGRLLVSRWNETDENYDLVQLGDSSWHLQNWDIRSIGLGRIESRVTFTDGNSTERVDIVVRRGLEDALIVPVNSISSGLQTRLDPIASDSATDPAERADIVARTGVE